MIYREVGQFKASYAADQAIFPIRQDRWLLLAALGAASLNSPAFAAGETVGVTAAVNPDATGQIPNEPLRELMRNFFDELKSVSSGYGSISYEIDDMREANVTRLDILVADEVVTYETALAAATDPAHFAQQLRGLPRRSRGAGRKEAAEASGGK